MDVGAEGGGLCSPVVDAYLMRVFASLYVADIYRSRAHTHT